MVPDQMWIEEECKYDIAAIAVRTHMRILSVVRIEFFSMYGYDYMKKIILCRADINEHIIAERDFKYLYPSDFEDLYQTQLNLTKPRWDATGIEYKHDYKVIDSLRAITFRDKYAVQMIMRFNEIYKFSDGTSHQIDEALDYRVKEFKVNKLNSVLNIRFWTRKDVDRSKEFMFSIQKRLKTRRIFRNLESFVGERTYNKASVTLTHAIMIQKSMGSQHHKKCMRTRRSYFPPTATIPRRSRKHTTNVVEPEIRTIVEMANNRTMAQMLQAPIEGYEDAIVVPPINANNFELKQTLINLVQSNQFTEGEARIWLDKEPPRSILTWEDLVSKFINQLIPPSKTTYLRNEIINFLQKPNKTFIEAWERSKDLLRQCPHHGGNFLDKIPRECLSIIKSKSKVRYSRSQLTVSGANTNAPLSSSLPSNSFDLQQIVASLEDKLDIRMNHFEKSLNDMKDYFITPTASIKAVKEVCVTCGANHSYNHCPLTRGNEFPVFHDNIQQFQTVAAVGNFMQGNRNQNVPNQMRPPGFNQPNRQNNQSRYQGNNFNSNQNRQNNQGAVYQYLIYYTL
nr:hypothetical protein [Tanacetum cinerariifolium]